MPSDFGGRKVSQGVKKQQVYMGERERMLLQLGNKDMKAKIFLGCSPGIKKRWHTK
jgi:hypothetical protein